MIPREELEGVAGAPATGETASGTTEPFEQRVRALDAQLFAPEASRSDS